MTHRPFTLDPPRLEALRHALLRKREHLLRGIAGLHEPSPVGEPGDLADLATTEIAVGERTELASHERALLAEVEHALAKIDAGTYGVSESTGAPIRWERLRALPWARTDVQEPIS